MLFFVGNFVQNRFPSGSPCHFVISANDSERQNLDLDNFSTQNQVNKLQRGSNDTLLQNIKIRVNYSSTICDIDLNRIMANQK